MISVIDKLHPDTIMILFTNFFLYAIKCIRTATICVGSATVELDAMLQGIGKGMMGTLLALTMGSDFLAW